MIKASFKWTIDPTVSLKGLSSAIQKKAMRIALNAGAAAVKNAVVSAAPKDLGHLARATAIKIYNPGGGKYKDSPVWVAIVGAGSKYKRTKRKNGKILRRTNKAGEVVKQYIRPAKYQQFVDQGTKHQNPKRYIMTAYQRSKTQFTQTSLQKLQEIIPELMKAKNK